MSYVRAHEIPPELLDWFGRLKGTVTVRYQPPGAEHPAFYEGKLTKVAATGAFVRLSGVLMDDMMRRTIDLPLDHCTLMPKRYGTGA